MVHTGPEISNGGNEIADNEQVQSPLQGSSIKGLTRGAAETQGTEKGEVREVETDKCKRPISNHRDVS